MIPSNSMDLPFEPSSGDLLDADARFAGGVVVMAATIPIPDVGVKPALVFRFAAPTGEFYPAMVLVCDDDQMAKLRPLVVEAVQAARRAATAAGGAQ